MSSSYKDKKLIVLTHLYIIRQQGKNYQFTIHEDNIIHWLAREEEAAQVGWAPWEHGRENEPVHRDGRAKQERVRSGTAPSARLFGAGSFGI
jgi:hypothetical protein